VCSTANIDENLRGYYTKFDNSSGDINPIGGISKLDLFALLEYWSSKDHTAIYSDIRKQNPKAELRSEDQNQIDEVDMGLT